MVPPGSRRVPPGSRRVPAGSPPGPRRALRRCNLEPTMVSAGGSPSGSDAVPSWGQTSFRRAPAEFKSRLIVSVQGGPGIEVVLKLILQFRCHLGTILGHLGASSGSSLAILESSVLPCLIPAITRTLEANLKKQLGPSRLHLGAILGHLKMVDLQY